MAAAKPDNARHVGLIGHGAIGRDLAQALLDKTSRHYRLSVLTRSPEKHRDKGSGRMGLVDRFDLEKDPPDLVVEAAGHSAVVDEVPRLLEAGIPVIIASIGVLADDAIRVRLEQLAAAHGTRLILPSGAVGGLDYLRLAAYFSPLSVRYTSRKPPAAWRQELAERGIEESAVGHELVLFEGSAREAAVLFPKNLNVAATLALAGTGMDDTRVRVVVDPSVAANRHEVEIEGPLGKAEFVFANAPSPKNPKTSRITAISLLDAVHGYFE